LDPVSRNNRQTGKPLTLEQPIRFLIDHQCPQCGAPATLEETDRLFACKFCRVTSYLIPNAYFQYVLPSKAPAGQSLIYFPFWRFKGMFFSCSPTGVGHKFMDLSYQAIEAPVFPISLGFRGQALKSRFVTSNLDGRFLSPGVSLHQVMEKFTRRFNDTMPKPILHSAHIGESLSLVYSPYYLDRIPFDAVLNEP